MADGSNPVGDMFSTFPIFFIILTIVAVYIFWRETGGIERGEARRAAGQNGLFIEVKNVPDSYGNQELFGAVPKPVVDDVLDGVEKE